MSFFRRAVLLGFICSSAAVAAPIFVYHAASPGTESQPGQDRYCGIHEDRVIIKTTVEGVTAVKEAAVAFDDGNIGELRAKVARLADVAPTVTNRTPQKFTTKLTGFAVSGGDGLVISESRYLHQSLRAGPDFLSVRRFVNEVCGMYGFSGTMIF